MYILQEDIPIVFDAITFATEIELFKINSQSDVTCLSAQQQWCVFKGALKSPITAADVETFAMKIW